MRTLLTVFAKEFLENLRDRRTLLSALLFGPLFGPLLFGLMVSRMLEQSVVESDVPLKITISGGHYAPGLIRYLEGRGVKLTQKELTENEARAAGQKRRLPSGAAGPRGLSRSCSWMRDRRRYCCSRTARIRRRERSPIAPRPCWAPTAARSRNCGWKCAASARC